MAHVPRARLRRAVWDVDGNEYMDFHNGFGVMCVGHANPVIAAAVKARMDEGTHFAAPTEGSIIVAEELRRRWGLPHWRFTNSGTESTMDADPPRARLHRPRHDRQDRGHLPRPSRRRDGLGQAAAGARWAPRRAPEPRRPTALGFAPGTAEHTRVVPFNDADALAAALDETRRRRDPGAGDDEREHRAAGRRATWSACASSRATTASVMIFDEVKTGAAVAAGGATELFGVTPDVVCLAKAMCGGLPGGAVGHDRRARPSSSPTGSVKQQGTFNGNPLTMAAAQATLLRRADRRRLHAAARRQRAADGRVRARDRRVRACPPTPSAWAPRAAS